MRGFAFERMIVVSVDLEDQVAFDALCRKLWCVCWCGRDCFGGTRHESNTYVGLEQAQVA